MTHSDHFQRYSENESYRDDQPRFRERGQYRDDRSFERAPSSEDDREFGRGPGRAHEREYRGGMVHHPTRPNLQRQNERERYGDDHGGRSFGSPRSHQGEDTWPTSQRGSTPWGQEREGWAAHRGQESRSFEPRAWDERASDAGGRGFGGSGYHSGSASGAYGGSSYGSGSHSSGYGSTGYGGESPGRNMERGPNQRSWQGSESGSQERLDGPHAGKGPKGFRRSDERLNEATCDCLERNGQLDASGIEVTCKDGIVTLKGTVDSRRAKRLAEEAAEGVYGVKDVMNELKVQKDTSAEGSGQHERSATSKADQSRQDSSSYADAGSTSSSLSTGTNQKR